MSNYRDVWSAIKRDKTCSIEVHYAVAAKVKKGVIREKDNDKGFKVINDHDKCSLKITHEMIDKNTVRISFTLRQKIGIEPLKNVGF